VLYRFLLEQFGEIDEQSPFGRSVLTHM
jgi:hypothetical protein